MKCPYDNCPFEGVEEEVDDHVIYMILIEDPGHEQDKKR